MIQTLAFLLLSFGIILNVASVDPNLGYPMWARHVMRFLGGAFLGGFVMLLFAVL